MKKAAIICLSAVSATLTDWSAWAECSSTCGLGTTKRTRECTGNEKICAIQKLEELKICDKGACCLDWSEWSSCCLNNAEDRILRTRARKGKCESTFEAQPCLQEPLNGIRTDLKEDFEICAESDPTPVHFKKSDFEKL
ncbi:Oidioi.mRNA.OKI2018_I69.chr2.g5098.t1.cds [Oikopleura dioica]|uniref:Oidioi.mRNA.OKI2018_I69.chr2.g5098.t1.cds n=1 Tax=Oikopleura dioica TaxID=34765 RepID=A0ABN7T8J3_OIKDI|nr:Oidioi.mRNA.OKI2018_I69.chr2.g5098.t1.cds [Oikopleura dioica]